jgi:hypothetical protein
LAANKIALPSKEVSAGILTAVTIEPSELVRISGSTTGEPFFGASGKNRFDAPGCLSIPPAPEFKTSYFGFSLEVAFAETVLHDEVAENGQFRIAPGTLASKYVITFKGKTLKVADLTGAPLKRIGGHADLTGTDNYDVTQQWSLAVYSNQGTFDGFIYMSRHLNTEKALILFDRASAKIQMKKAISLLSVPEFAETTKLFSIVSR